jgi:SWI/SNF-related matrix-associated actin-dependent regulator of chromatin subfamily B protein 1
MSNLDIQNVHEWIEKDKAFMLAGAEKLKHELRNRTMKWSIENDRGTPWWSVRKGERPPVPRGRIKIVWPHDRAVQKAKGSKRKEIRL